MKPEFIDQPLWNVNVFFAAQIMSQIRISFSKSPLHVTASISFSNF